MRKLSEGKTYKLITFKREGVHRIKTTRKMRLVKKYRHFGLFENSRGIRECFTYWELEKLLKGQEIYE